MATKNVKLSVNFSSPAWSEVEGVEGYVQLQDATEEHKMRAVKVSLDHGLTAVYSVVV